MKLPKLNPWYLVLIVGLVVLAMSLMQKCNRTSKVDRLTEQRFYAKRLDSLKTIESNKRRVLLDSLSLTYEARKARIDTLYQDVLRYDTRVEIRYRERPTLEKADTVIASKNKRIGLLEDKDKVNTLLVRTKDGIIANRDSLITSKDATIYDLNDGYTKAVLQLDKYNRKRVVISAGGGYGIGTDAKPRAYVGVQVGYKLFEF